MTIVEPRILFDQKTDDAEIRVWQQYDRRWLEFNDGLIQSEIILNRPEILPSVLNRAMLAGMMFSQQPKRVLLAGVGGGATARYFSGCFPDVIGEAVEISETVSQIANDFFEFPMNNKWQLITENILDYMQNCQHKYDLIIIDMVVEQVTPEWIVEQEFLQQCRTMLTENGQLSLNLLVDNDDDFKCNLSAIRDVFDRQTVCLSLANHRNTVIFAFNKKPQILPAELDKHIPILEALWGLEFGEFYQQMLKDNPPKSGVF
jgi:spermidine synthase